MPGAVVNLLPGGGQLWDGRRLLVVADQGYSDAILFGRLLPEVARRCPDPVLACGKELQPVLHQLCATTLVHNWQDVPPPDPVRSHRAEGRRFREEHARGQDDRQHDSRRRHCSRVVGQPALDHQQRRTVDGGANVAFYGPAGVLGSGPGWSVTNAGRVTSVSNQDIVLRGGGSVSNASTGVIQAYQAISIALAPGGTVTNTGTINKSNNEAIRAGASGTGRNGTYQGGILLSADTSAAVVGTGDFNGDGTADILLQEGDAVTVWLMTNGTIGSVSVISTSANVLSTNTNGFTVVPSDG